MQEKETISDAIQKFSEKLERFNKAENSDKKIEKPLSKEQILKTEIENAENEKIQKITNIYSSFRFPVSKSVEEDEESLYKCYTLFKSILELNKTSGNNLSFIKRVEFESPIIHKDFYATGNKFIFLSAWLFFEKKVNDFVPILISENSGKIRLDFEELENHHFSAEERMIFDTIKENVYK